MLNTDPTFEYACALGRFYGSVKGVMGVLAVTGDKSRALERIAELLADVDAANAVFMGVENGEKAK